MNAKPKRDPIGDGKLLAYLRKVARRMNPAPMIEGHPDTLTAGDRTFAATILAMIARDEDPRPLFWSAVAHRPKGDGGSRFAVAMVYESRVALGQAKRGKRLVGDLAALAGLTDAQVDHAVREHQSTVQALLADESPEAIASRAENALLQLAARRGK